KVFQGRNSISWAKSILPVFIKASRDHPGSLRQLQIVDTALCPETRITPGVQSRRLSVNRTAVVCDQTIALDGHGARQHYPERLRRVRYRDAKTSKTLVFLTNNFDLPASTIAALYKNRWQVELFFKWIKQHLRIKQFYGKSENAVKTQIWCAVATYVLI